MSTSVKRSNRLWACSSPFTSCSTCFQFFRVASMFFPACTPYSAPSTGAAATVSPMPPMVFAARRAYRFHAGMASSAAFIFRASSICACVQPPFWIRSASVYAPWVLSTRRTASARFLLSPVSSHWLMRSNSSGTLSLAKLALSSCAGPVP